MKSANRSILIDHGAEPLKTRQMSANLATAIYMPGDAGSTWSFSDFQEAFPEVFATNADTTLLEDTVITAKRATTATKSTP